ncbi:MAG: polysaccharide deacetylase [Verrucomicrobiae bacterium]|nr:polysaccharide deacetylase [Verrucomicrobiae bacterium]
MIIKRNNVPGPAGQRPVFFLAACLLTSGMIAAGAQTDAVTGFSRENLVQKQWKPGKKVAVCFVLYVEVWGFGQGPNFRPDMAARKPDLVNEAFRNYAIDFGVERVGGVFRESRVPLSVALNALFPVEQPVAWKKFRTLVPQASLLAHGMNNTSEMLPLAGGLAAQEKYIKQTLDLIEKETGVRPKGWSSPSVYGNQDTFRASAASGIAYTLDAMDSDHLSILDTPAGRLLLIPYPPVTVDMGQFLGRNQTAREMGQLWTDYVGELAREAKNNPDRPATVVAIGIHPFVMGSPDGAAALRRTLETLKKMPQVWLTDTDTVMEVSKSKLR